jgi:DNA-binding MarR family transcriptional regulator
MDFEAVDLLRGVVARLARQLNATSTAEGLTPTQSSVLGVIVSRGPMKLATISEIEGLNPTMLSRVVTRLYDAHLITRDADPSDLRTATVSATTVGRRMHRRIKAQRSSVLSRRMSMLTDEQQATLISALPALQALSAELHKSNSTEAKSRE